MFTTGSKLLIGSAVMATVAALAYGVTQTEALGIVGLVSAAIALAFLAGINVWAHDSNLSAMDATAVATSEAAANPPGASVWPLVFAVGASTVLVGLVSQQSIFTIGLVILLAAGAQWVVQAWAERASNDATVNAAVRNRIANALEYPLMGAIGVGAIAFSMSRVMLWLSKTNTVIAFVVLATLVACAAFFFAFRPSIKRGAIGGALSLGAVAIVASGVAAGVDGQRVIHPHETISADAAFFCDSPKPFEVDENNSQTVAGKANTYTITLIDDDTLTFDVPGPVEAGADALSLPRSSASNIVFRNESGEERRLTVDLGPLPPETADEGGVADEAVITDEDGEPLTKSDRVLLCTSLVEAGGAQLLTLDVDAPSLAVPGGYRFYVPGSEAQLGLIVP